jgi:hypothetical protein
MIAKLWPSDDGTRMRQGQKVVVVGPVPVFAAGEVVEDAERRERAHPEVIIEVRDGHIVVWGGVSFWPSLMRSLNRTFRLLAADDTTTACPTLYRDVEVTVSQDRWSS